MSLRELLGERELLLFLLAIMVFFVAVGILFEVPGSARADHPDGTRSRTLQQMGLEDPSLEDKGRELPGILRTWNNQLLIGH
jgi:hypothetical protein